MQEFYKVSIYQRLAVNRHLVFKWETIYLYRDLIKSYRSLLDWDRTLAAKLLVWAEYLSLCNMREAFSSISVLVWLRLFLCDKTLAANDFCVAEVSLLFRAFDACDASVELLLFVFIIILLYINNVFQTEELTFGH